MAGDPRKHGSKCYTQEGALDVYEISKDESPQNMDIHGEGSDVVPRPEASMHRSNEDMKGIQSKASSKRSHPSKLDDEHDGKGCDVKSAEACSEKPDGNQGMNNDGRGGGDAWGSTLDHGCPSNKMPSDSDPWRHYRRNPSPIRDRDTSQRDKSRSRRRSRERSRGRTCWDFAAGRCWRGLNCKFRHEDGGVQLSRPFQQEHYYPAGATEWYGYHSSWRAEEEARQSGYAYERFGPGSSSYGSTMMEHRSRVSNIPCKFFTAGHCRYGANCQYLHETAAAPPQLSQMELRLISADPDERWSYNYNHGRAPPSPPDHERWNSHMQQHSNFPAVPPSISAHTSQMMPPMAAAGGAAGAEDSDGYSIMSMTLPAAAGASTVLQAAAAEENKKSDNNKDVDVQAALKAFKFALAEFAKEALKPTWRQKRLSKEAYKTVVKKVVDKVTTAEKIPPPKDKIDAYITLSKDKLNKLVQEYVARFARA